MTRTLGLDIGTTTVSGLVLDVESGKIICSDAVESDAFIEKGPDVREQDPARLLDATGALLSRLAEECGGSLDVDGIGITGQMHGCILLDSCLEPVSPLITWQDRRTLQLSPSGKTWMDEFNDISRKCSGGPGMNAAPGYMGPTVFVLKSTGAMPDNVAFACFSHDWLICELCRGKLEKPVTDPSFAHSSGLYSAREGKWREDLLDGVSVDIDILPEVVSPGTLVAYTGHSALPLKTGIPVFVGMGDNQASVYGSTSAFEESVILNIGTGGQVSCVVNEYTDLRNIETRPFMPESFLLVGASLCGGWAYALLKDFVVDVGRRVFGVAPDDSHIYSMLAECAEPDTDLLCETTFAGTRSDPDKRGCIAGISESNLTIGHFVTAVIDGIVRELYAQYQAMGLDRRILVGAGNALERNHMMRARAEHMFGIPMTLAPSESATLGPARLAGLGLARI